MIKTCHATLASKQCLDNLVARNKKNRSASGPSHEDGILKCSANNHLQMSQIEWFG